MVFWTVSSARLTSSIQPIDYRSLPEIRGKHQRVNKIVYIYDMNPIQRKYKGIHPGRIIGRELKKRSIKQGPFAISIGEYPQTLNAITKGRRRLNTSIAMKIEEKLGLEEGSLVLFQAYFDIEEEKRRRSKHPDFSILRKALFWDTDVENIDWEKKYKAVIRRVIERGNEDERKEMIRFYGPTKFNSVANSINPSYEAC